MTKKSRERIFIGILIGILVLIVIGLIQPKNIKDREKAKDEIGENKLNCLYNIMKDRCNTSKQKDLIILPTQENNREVVFLNYECTGQDKLFLNSDINFCNLDTCDIKSAKTCYISGEF